MSDVPPSANLERELLPQLKSVRSKLLDVHGCRRAGADTVAMCGIVIAPQVNLRPKIVNAMPYMFQIDEITDQDLLRGYSLTDQPESTTLRVQTRPFHKSRSHQNREFADGYNPHSSWNLTHGQIEIADAASRNMTWIAWTDEGITIDGVEASRVREIDDIFMPTSTPGCVERVMGIVGLLNAATPELDKIDRWQGH